ncbi:hypothetical protein PULV_a3966 [Pseudoalteromonas ulvae UL12]|uniref:hypothetical protein n=1 Tax=Pseudoalteromonas ulvae TaxID=107327 RepID=UPI00186BB08F|nr:hypothetical protein [Pseudoalteromonas ulvae]MBE0362158.1 hypothetical protein [Pseudoalteromonas ulvae UL12]
MFIEKIIKTKKTVIAGVVVCSVTSVNASEHMYSAPRLNEIKEQVDALIVESDDLLLNEIKVGQSLELAQKTKKRHDKKRSSKKRRDKDSQFKINELWDKIMTNGKGKDQRNA